MKNIFFLFLICCLKNNSVAHFKSNFTKGLKILVFQHFFKFEENKLNDPKLRIFFGSFVSFRFIGIMVRVFANGPGDQGAIPGGVIPKTLKMVLDASLLNTQHYKVRIKGKVEKSWEKSSPLPYTLVL